MSLEQLKAFLAKVKGDSNLQEKLKAAKSPEDVVTIAKEYGLKVVAVPSPYPTSLTRLVLIRSLH